MRPSAAAVQRLAPTARRQFGAFSRPQALDAGVSSSTLALWVSTGRYRLLLPGVMAGAEVPDTWEVRAMAAVLAVGGEVALARQSAARLHGLDLPGSVTNDLALVVRTRTFPTLPTDIRVHRTRRLPNDHVARIGVFPATTPARTICDLAGQVGPTALRRTVAHAVRNDLADAVRLRVTMGGLGRIRGKCNLRAVCDELSPLEEDCRSELESRFLRLATRTGITPTAMNHPVTDADGRRRFLDAAYLPELVGVELDSKLAHGSRLDHNDDQHRQDALELVGWRIVRFDWSDVVERSGRVVATIRRRLATPARDP